MRTGVTASATAHLALILVVIIGLNFAHALPTPPIESISVDLVPLTDTANVRLGSEKSKVLDTPAPAIVDSQKPATLAQPTGDTDQDQVHPKSERSGPVLRSHP